MSLSSKEQTAQWLSALSTHSVTSDIPSVSQVVDFTEILKQNYFEIAALMCLMPLTCTAAVSRSAASLTSNFKPWPLTVAPWRLPSGETLLQYVKWHLCCQQLCRHNSATHAYLPNRQEGLRFSSHLGHLCWNWPVSSLIAFCFLCLYLFPYAHVCLPLSVSVSVCF